MKIPCFENTVFGVVPTMPSGPPSLMTIWPISTIARLPSLTAPGTAALAEVFAEHVAPMAVLAVATQDALIGYGMSTTVAGSVPPPATVALKWSVIRIVALPCRPPV
jgi:hypothetical protein